MKYFFMSMKIHINSSCKVWEQESASVGGYWGETKLCMMDDDKKPFVNWDKEAWPVTLSCTSPCVISPKEKEKKRNIDNDLAILLSHNTIPLLSFLVLRIFTTCNKGQPYYSFCLHFLLSILLLLNLLAEFLLPSPQLFPRFFFSLLVLLSSISNFFLIFPSILHHIFYPSIQIISSLWTSLAIFLF